MSKIIVAIDFSDCSINAFLHALSIAQNTKSDIVLVWVQKAAGQTDKFEKGGQVATNEVEKAFEDLITKYQPELPANKILWKIRTGKVYNEIPKEAKTSKAFLVVAGTHGA